MKTKKYIWRTIKLLSIILALAVCVGLLQEYVLIHADHNRERVKGFYLEDKDSLDVVIIGSSEVYSGYSAGYVYQQHGITSYPYAIQSNSIKNLKSQIQEVIENQHPQLLVVELNGATYPDDEQIDKDANFRNYVDNMPFNQNKIDLVSREATSDQIEYYLPIVKYHSVWNDFPKGFGWAFTNIQDQLRGYNLLKGMKNKTAIYVPNEKVYNDELSTITERNKISEKAESYLREALEYCKSENIDNVVFTRFPHVVVKKWLKRYYRNNTVSDIVAEYGYDYLNFERDFTETGLDVNTDFYNTDHLNVYGQKKFTDYFINILIDKYGVTASELTEAQTAEWEEAAKYYDAYYKLNDEYIQNNHFTDLNEFFSNINEMQKYITD